MNYFDRDGKPLKAGDILKYDEGEGGAKAIHEIVDVNGGLCGVTRIGEPLWSTVTDDKPISLKFYCSYPYTSGVARDAVVIGNISDNPEILTVGYAKEIFDAV